MDFLSIFGIVVAIGCILFGQHLEGGHASSLVNPPAFVIVFGGTIGAVMLETSMATLIIGAKMVKYVFFPKKINYLETIEKIVGWSNIVRKQGLLGLEAVANKEEAEFERKALFMLIDGTSAKAIQEALEVEVEYKSESQIKAAKIFESLGGYAPTVGIVGAVLGLIHVMGNLDDPSKLGGGIASAFVATVYGIGFANIFCLPICKKLQYLVALDVKLSIIIIEGVMSISQGDNPKIIETKLKGFLE
jgi:chemotaxis protein MotA